jgi:hypothetical protein
MCSTKSYFIMKKNLLKFNDVQMMTRDQMKNIKGGLAGAQGTRCVLYCCPSNCSTPQATAQMTCNSNEECQTAGVSQGWACTGGDYVAALCKG